MLQALIAAMTLCGTTPCEIVKTSSGVQITVCDKDVADNTAWSDVKKYTGEDGAFILTISTTASICSAI